MVSPENDPFQESEVFWNNIFWRHSMVNSLVFWQNCSRWPRSWRTCESVYGGVCGAGVRDFTGDDSALRCRSLFLKESSAAPSWHNLLMYARLLPCPERICAAEVPNRHVYVKLCSLYCCNAALWEFAGRKKQTADSKMFCSSPLRHSNPQVIRPQTGIVQCLFFLYWTMTSTGNNSLYENLVFQTTIFEDNIMVTMLVFGQNSSDFRLGILY